MAKSVHDDVLDAALNHLKNQSQKITCCDTQPTTYTEAAVTYKLAESNISGADFTGPAEGDTSGRKVGVGSKADVPVSTTGSAEFFCLVDSSGAGRLLYVTEVSGVQTVTDGNTMTFGTWDVEILDPT